jgi:hypothetical protein
MQKVGAPTIRPLTSTDHAGLLKLNAENYPAVTPLDEAELAHLLKFDGYHLVAEDAGGTVVGYLLSFPRGSEYDDTEFRWLRHRLSGSFFYICQVVVAPEYRRQQIGRALYRDLIATARQRGAQNLCCDVNAAPPNLVSFAFHHRLGFDWIGFGHASDGRSITFLARQV